MPTIPLCTIRERIVDKSVALLIAYRKNCAAATAPSQVRPLIPISSTRLLMLLQLILPEQFKLLPIYSLCILKCRALKGEYAHFIKCMPNPD